MDDALQFTPRSTTSPTSLQSGLGKIAQPVRVAVTGTAVSPPIDATLALLGRERTLARLDAALARDSGGVLSRSRISLASPSCQA